MSYSRIQDHDSTQPKWLQNYEKNVRTNRLWRHSFGRVSCLARIPIYTTAVGLQTAKTLGKTIASPITYLGVGLAWLFKLDKKPLNSWRFEGIAKDALMDLKLLDKIGSSAMGVIFAPPKKYASLRAAFRSSTKITVLGKYHGKSKGGSEYTLEDVQKLTFLTRPDYSKLVLDQKRIYTPPKGTHISLQVLEKIHAG